jgi:hypothetical protein
MSEWQSIETAPKDGTVILAYRYQLGSLSWLIVMFNRGSDTWFDYYTGMQVFPTHWMPLPEPPG